MRGFRASATTWRRPPAPATTSGSAWRMYRSILGAHASILISLCLFATAPWLGKSWVTSGMAIPRGFIAIVLLVTAFEVFRHGEQMRHLVLLVITFVLATPWLGLHPVPNDVTVGMVLSAVGLMAARLLWLPIALSLVVVCAGAHVLTIELLQITGAGLTLDSMVLALSTASAAVSFVNALQASAVATERVALTNQHRELELAREVTERDAKGLSQRVLHDDVLGTLHLIADGSASVERIRRQCAEAVEKLRSVLDRASALEPSQADILDHDLVGLPGPYARLVHAIRAASPIAVELEVEGRRGRLPVVSADRFAVLQRAVLEGVRNAARHGGAQTVTLFLRADRRLIQVEVRDRGVGLAEGTTDGFGLTESVRLPLAAVGGSADLSGRAGGGTALAMAMPRQDASEVGDLERAHVLTTASLGPIQKLSRAVALPLAVAWTVVAIHSTLLHPETAPQLILCLGWLIATWLIVRRVERRAPTAMWVIGMGSALVTLQIAGLVMMAPGAMLDFRSWSIGMSALPLVVFVLNLPVRVGAVALSLHPAIVLGASLVQPELSAGLIPWGSLNAVVTCPVPSLVLGWLIRRQGLRLQVEQAREFELEHEAAVRQWRAATAQLFLAHVRRDVLPWLMDVASGKLEAAAAETREHARLLAVAARDDLYAPGFFDEGLRRDVARFREQGGTVELRAGLSPGASGRTIGRVLAELLPLSSGHRIIVSPPVDSEPRVRISVVPAPLAPAIEHLSGRLGAPIATDVDEFRAVLLVEDIPVSG